MLSKQGGGSPRTKRTTDASTTLEAFAWTTVLNVARSYFARSSMRVVGATLSPEASDAVLSALHARDGTREQIETDILVQQLLARLTPEERDLYYWKAWGYSSREIARARDKSEGHVNTARVSHDTEASRLVTLDRA